MTYINALHSYSDIKIEFSRFYFSLVGSKYKSLSRIRSPFFKRPLNYLNLSGKIIFFLFVIEKSLNYAYINWKVTQLDFSNFLWPNTYFTLYFLILFFILKHYDIFSPYKSIL